MTKKIKVSLEWKLLTAIADYYEFPTTVFLTTPENFEKMKKAKTRNEFFRKKTVTLDKVIDTLVEDRWVG